MIADSPQDNFETRLIGDSIIREQLQEFCGRCPATRKRFCIPGARLRDITAACDEVTRDADTDTLLIIHAGTNDVHCSNSEDLLEKFKLMIETYKTKTNRLVISGILPRIDAGRDFYNKAYSTNNRLKALCLQVNVKFINLWDQFYDEPALFHDDGLHLNKVGSARFGRLINEQVSLYRSKNAERSGAPPTT